MDDIMRGFAEKATEWKEDLYFTVKCARPKLAKYYAELTPTTSMHFISAHILNPFLKWRSFRKWEKGIDINSEDESAYTTQDQMVFLK